MLSRPTPIRATTRSAGEAAMAVADTGAQQVRIAAGRCDATRSSIAWAGAGSAGPATSVRPAAASTARSIVSSGQARSVSSTVAVFSPLMMLLSARGMLRPEQCEPGLAVSLPVVFGVGHLRTPVRCALGDGQVGHEVPGAGSMPVLLAVGSEDDVAGTELHPLLAARLRPAASLRHVEGLAAVVGMPGGAGTGREVHGVHGELRRRQSPGDRVHPYLAGERLGRPLSGRRLAGYLHGPSVAEPGVP